METLLVQLDQNQQSARWLVLDDKGQPNAAMRSGGLEQLKDFSQQRRIFCLVDGSNIFLDSVVLPSGRNRRKLLQAIPFALEDDLAEDLESLHFAIGKEQSDTAANDEEAEEPAGKQITVPVAIISRDNLSQWLDTLSEAGIRPHALFPDLLALPQNEGEWHVLVDGDKAAVRTGQQSGFSCDLANLEVLLEACLKQHEPKPTRIQILNHNPSELALSLQDTDVELVIKNMDQAALTTLARSFDKASQIDLLQGEFSFREEYGKLIKNWLAPAVLLGALLLLTVVAKSVTYIQLESKSETLKEQKLEAYKTVFPNSKNFTDLRQQLQNKLDSLGGGGENSPLLQIMDAVATQISTIAGATLQALDYNGDYLDIELIVGEFQQLEKMRQQLQNQGLNAEIKSTDKEGDRVIGEIRLRLQ